MGVNEQSFGRKYWEDRYAESELAWSGKPNSVLVTEARKLSPGRAIDIGSGEGADALWLAMQGWQVTGIDFASSGLAKARARAEATDRDAAARIDWQRRDVTEWAPAPRSFDLVSAQFMHMPEPTRSALFRSLAAAVAPGGALLIVGHDADDFAENSDHRAHLVEKMFTVDNALAAINDEGLSVKIAESRRREAPVPGGTDFHHDIVVMARREPERAERGLPKAQAL